MEPFYFAAVGDVHGEIHKMHGLLKRWVSATNRELAFVLQVGDFEPHRHEADLATMAAPAKYRVLGDFGDYHRGQRHFPWPTWFIGGNHEPYGYLDTMPQGGTLLNNLHYLGRVGQRTIEGLRIGGLSGIHVETAYQDDRPPISAIEKTSKKAYIGFTEDEVAHALGWQELDILLIHDWPADTIAAADKPQFLGRRRAVDPETVGNEPAKMLVELLQPKLVLCGHMHMAYQNTMHHTQDKTSEIHCLASIHQGQEALAFFQAGPEGITRID